jgi:hypothetical protein
MLKFTPPGTTVAPRGELRPVPVGLNEVVDISLGAEVGLTVKSLMVHRLPNSFITTATIRSRSSPKLFRTSLKALHGFITDEFQWTPECLFSEF